LLNDGVFSKPSSIHSSYSSGSPGHYSIEHVCSYLGISAENCLRIAALSTGEIDLEAFKKSLECVISQGKKIAAVIAVAGGTINLIPDPISLIKNAIDQISKDHDLDYIPYLHVDSVITWAWLAFKGSLSHLAKYQDHPSITRKIQTVLSKLVGIKYADSFAADFHKTGFCPYAAGVFVMKESKDLLGMTSSGYTPPKNPFFGELEPLRQTFENSRSALPIVSIWIAIRKLGLEGVRQFILYQLEVCELFKQKIREKYDEHFEILNEHSNGWEIVFKPHFCERVSWDHLQEASIEEQQDYINNCYAFVNDCWYSPIEDEALGYPVIGFIPKYSRKGVYEKSLPALLIHPTSLHYDETAIEEMIDKIFDIKIAFDLRRENRAASSGNEYLYAMVPPR
jgi:glutamate/tyrosine decarboxylase-like PLP-dependent enzyme